MKKLSYRIFARSLEESGDSELALTADRIADILEEPKLENGNTDES